MGFQKPIGTLVLDLQYKFSVSLSDGQFSAVMDRLESRGPAEYDRLSNMSLEEFKEEFPESR